jgi:membrane-bound lytic murein transglycosylase B
MLLRSLLLLLLFFPFAVRAADLPGIPLFIEEMVAKHHFSRDELELTFKRAVHRPDIIEAISAPATLKPWIEYRPNFINPKRIAGGVAFWKKYHKALARAEREFGVPQEIILGVIGVETLYGKNAGKNRALDALTTLTFDYPRRATFFRGELEEFLLLAREQDFNLLGIQASYAGALGIPQFMPSNYRKLAVDYNGNGKIDLMNEPEDAIGSVANFLKFHGWHKGELIAIRADVSKDSCAGDIITPRTVTAWKELGVLPFKLVDQNLPSWLLDFTAEKGKEFWLAFNNFAVITHYNNSNFYAMSVYQLAQAVINARAKESRSKVSR